MARERESAAYTRRSRGPLTRSGSRVSTGIYSSHHRRLRTGVKGPTACAVVASATGTYAATRTRTSTGADIRDVATYTTRYARRSPVARCAPVGAAPRRLVADETADGAPAPATRLVAAALAEPTQTRTTPGAPVRAVVTRPTTLRVPSSAPVDETQENEEDRTNDSNGPETILQPEAATHAATTRAAQASGSSSPPTETRRIATAD